MTVDRQVAHGFDFLIGTWTIASRRLKERLAGSDDWLQSNATTVCQSLFGGAANINEVAFPAEGFTGMTCACSTPRKRNGRCTETMIDSDNVLLLRPARERWAAT